MNVVTASKNESSKLTTQGNIASINAEEIKFLGAHNPGEIINRLPGIYISQGSGQEQALLIVLSMEYKNLIQVI